MKPSPVIINRIRLTLGLAATAIMAVSCAHTAPPVVVAITGAARDITRLTQSPQGENNPAVSLDGKTVAFQEFKDGQSGIWTLDSTSGRNLVQVTSLPCNEVHPSWLPDSRTLVFSSDRLGSFALWRRLASGAGGATMITKGGDMIDFAPSASPKGKKIVFTSRRRNTKETAIIVNGVQQFTMLEKNLPYIWTVNVDGTDLTQLTQGAYPVWSPDGMSIAFSSDVSGNWGIWTMNADGSAATQLTTTPGKNQFAPSYSPDGKWIAYTSNVSGNYDLWIMKADGSAQTQLTSDKHQASNPCWGSDSNIYYSSNASGNWEIWRLTPVLPE